MTDTVVFPKVEAELVRVLGERLPGLPVAAQVRPQVIPESGCVLVLAVGGTGRTLALSQRLVQVFVWAGTASAAAALIEQVVAAVVDAGRDPAEKRVRGVGVAGEPSFNPDPDSSMPRYSATLILVVRGKPTG
ncbi:hypothetical protein [Gordonia sp. (in: high G+C Gram-positive bacteria)]|jgi:hypothetical protein|uniref:hypothetical protein n=1 Tax=Gordonia sp. (in: high G+C Gram-positive bacteria) TaxID=84139 RepID=UPI001E1494F3|nr:hypothetical protein [Gordonia sp. (in: high G+C Gram-positive bacteria)]MCB1293644.1 hypothetical protein [Gordonia sp. (in: high G+C Gram-positive bacteria)]